ncbi:MAG: hypothetical protein EOL87_00225 [Spartobacteria bacterium]|nr:hypothetical protein [Spartobacteria bacterium]
MQIVKVAVGLVSLVGCVLALILVAGCEVGSGDTVTRDVDANITGRYDGSPLVETSDNADISWLYIEQTGDDLQGYDNHGIHFGGSIGSVSDGGMLVSINMDGHSKSGAEGTLSATINVSGSTATLQGSWIESGFVGYAEGTATVVTSPTATPTATSTNTASLTTSHSGIFIAGTIERRNRFEVFFKISS